MITTYARGNLIYKDGDNWRYAMDDSIYDDSKPCVRCGQMPTPEGYDHCLGHIKGATSACCGHGKGKSYVVYSEEFLIKKDKTVKITRPSGDLLVFKKNGRDIIGKYDATAIAIDRLRLTSEDFYKRYNFFYNPPYSIYLKARSIVEKIYRR